MYAIIQRELKRISTRKLVALTVISSVIITTGLSSLIGYLGWGRVSLEVLLIGTIDAIIVPAIVAPVLIMLTKQNIDQEELIQTLQQEIAERKRAEAEAQQQAESLLAVSELAIECAATKPDVPLEAVIADKLVQITKAMAVSLSIYEPDDQILEIRYVAAPAPTLAAVKKLLGRNIIGLAMPVEPAMLEQMLKEVVTVSEDLSEITFGIIPKSIATVIRATFNIGKITVLALNYGDELVGTIGLVMRAGQPPLDPELAQTLANITSVSLQRKKAEAALSLAEEKYRTIVDNAIEGIFQSTPDGRFLSVNPAMARMYGYASPEEMIQSVAKISEQVYVDAYQRFEVKQRLETEGYVQNYKMQDCRKDGTLFWTSMNVRTVRDEQGNTLYYEGILTDITARKEAEEALRRSEERYRNFIEQSTEGIWMIAFDEPIPIDLPPEEQVRRIQTLGYVAECNDAQARMYGYDSSQEVIGLRLLQHYGDYSEANFQATLKLVQDGYRSSNRETQEITASGETVYFLNHAVGVIEEGQLVALWGTQQDITSLKHAEQALRDSEQKFRTIIEQATEGFTLVDQSGHIIEWNQAQERISGLSRADVLGQPFWKVQFRMTRPERRTPDRLEYFKKVTLKALQTGRSPVFNQPLEAVVIHSLSGQRRFIQQTIFPVKTDHGFRIGSVTRDITARQQVEAEREKLIADLEVKNSELERFTYTVSHDLKSPLITIQGFLGYLERDVLAGRRDRLKADINRINEATDRMEGLLNDLLELSRIGRLMNPPEAVPFQTIVREALKMVEGRLAGRSVTVKVAEDLPLVYGDRARLVEVVQNLVDNAAKYMGDQSQPRIEIGWRRQKGEPVFFVQDNGIGILPEYHEKVFGLFDKLDTHNEGTGIGLALVKRIVEVHGGRIWVESAGTVQGSTFLFTLPFAPREEGVAGEQNNTNS